MPPQSPCSSCLPCSPSPLYYPTMSPSTAPSASSALQGKSCRTCRGSSGASILSLPLHRARRGRLLGGAPPRRSRRTSGGTLKMLRRRIGSRMRQQAQRRRGAAGRTSGCGVIACARGILCTETKKSMEPSCAFVQRKGVLGQADLRRRAGRECPPTRGL